MLPNYYQLVIAAILIFIKITNTSNYEDSIYLEDNYENKLSVLRRYERQTSQCVIPSYPLYTKYKILGRPGQNFRSGDYVPNFATIGITCDKGFKLSPFAQNFSVCTNGLWVPSLRSCLRVCPSLTSIVSTHVSCMYGATPLDNCYNPVEATTALVSCNPLYEDSRTDTYPSHICSDGRWEPSIQQCQPVCGQKRPVGKINLINGQDTLRGDYPWHVGIYTASNEGFICGGSIIDRNIVLSAAHCFTNVDGNVLPKEGYLVAAGKYYRTYDHNSDGYAQYSQIQKIIVPERYRGFTTLQALDIAVLVLESPFSISSAVQPVCIELNEQLQQLYLTSNSVGVVIGWGHTQEGGELAEVLQELAIPYIPFQQCYDEVPNNFKQYLNLDKICGGYKDSGTSVCSGDSGGGLVFNNINTDRFYIKGVASTSPATEQNICDSNQYSLYTAIAAHIDFIRNAITRNRLRYKIECKYDQCASEEPEDEETFNDGDNDIYKKCCAPGANCKYFQLSCKNHRTLFRRMVEMVL